MATMNVENAPNHTLYVNRINEKVKQTELRSALYALFGQYGKVVDLKAYRKQHVRGQAWVVFDDLNCATKALRELQGYVFFNKPISVSYAKEKSDYISKRDGTYTGKRKPAEQLAKQVKKAAAAQEDEEMDLGERKKSAVASIAPQPPNKILFVQNLPEDTKEGALAALFEQYAGFREVRLIPSRPGIAFIEFDDEYSSGMAMEALQSFKFTPKNVLAISYAKQ